MTANTAFKAYASENGGRVVLLFLLFLLALYEFFSAGFTAFAVICMLPVLAIMVILAFHFSMFTFWALIIINYMVQWKDFPIGSIPISLPNEMLELLLLALALLNVKETQFGRVANVMFIALLAWCSYCILEVLNDTCGIGMDVGSWYTSARALGFQVMYCFLVFSLYVNSPKILTRYLFLWGVLSLFAVFWVWKQQYIGFTHNESVWLQTRGRTTHILQAGTLIRYFSIYSDAANFGIGIASTAVAFLIFGITSKIRKHKIFFLIVGLGCSWAMFPSGTRTAIACFMAGVMAFVFLSKSVKISVPVSILFVLFVFILAFTKIGNGNQQIRRMRSAFDKNDASASVRHSNQEAMKKYLAEAPWGIGMHIGYQNAPANNKYTYMATIPPDSEYVFIWIHTGIIGITTFLICMAVMILGACWIVMFRLRSPSLRGIGAGFCCAMISQQMGGYGNQVLLQFPNCVAFFGGLSIVYILPLLEEDWIAYEEKQLVKQEEKKRLKLEKKRASRV